MRDMLASHKERLPFNMGQVIATNSTGWSWEDNSAGKEAYLYYDPYTGQMMGYIYEYNRSMSPWSQRDDFTVLWDEPLESKVALQQFNKAKGKSFAKNRAGWNWSRQWRVKEPPRDFNSTGLLNIWKAATKAPLEFIIWDYGIINMRKLEV